MNSFRFSSFWASICAAIMGLLGFSCSNDEDMALMYGTPIADFEIKGVVFTEKGNKPVPDAVIKVMEVPVPDPYFPEEDITDREVTYFRTATDNQGCYSATEGLLPVGIVKVVCVLPEINLQSDTVLIRLEFVEDGNNNNPWYYGKATAEVNFSLKEKPAER
ncbi:MAG: radical SAM-associated putative lipoprotein [Muribaculaceae bacterium]|nr:radical SAM-associated putative lipoprotein [Muribaculaceae bacterium]MDE7189666.1 radical SAM-associated putative lipoprotein [Muribaculaceae bacterium]